MEEEVVNANQAYSINQTYENRFNNHEANLGEGDDSNNFDEL